MSLDLLSTVATVAASSTRRMIACGIDKTNKPQLIPLPNLFSLSGKCPIVCFHHTPCHHGLKCKLNFTASELKTLAAVAEGQSLFTLPPKMVLIAAVMLEQAGIKTDVETFPQHWSTLDTGNRLTLFATFAPRLKNIPPLPLTQADLNPRTFAVYKQWAYFWRRCDNSHFHLHVKGHHVPGCDSLPASLRTLLDELPGRKRLMGSWVQERLWKTLGQLFLVEFPWLDIWLPHVEKVDISVLKRDFQVGFNYSYNYVCLTPHKDNPCQLRIRLRLGFDDPLFYYTNPQNHIYIDWSPKSEIQLVKFTPASIWYHGKFESVRTPWAMDFGYLNKIRDLWHRGIQRPIEGPSVKFEKRPVPRRGAFCFMSPKVQLVRSVLLDHLLHPNFRTPSGYPLPITVMFTRSDLSHAQFKLAYFPNHTFSVTLPTGTQLPNSSVAAVYPLTSVFMTNRHIHFPCAKIHVLTHYK